MGNRPWLPVGNPRRGPGLPPGAAPGDDPGASGVPVLPDIPITDWIAFSLLPGLGPLLQQRALERWGSPGEIAYRVPAGDFCDLPRYARLRSHDIRAARRDLRRRAEREEKRCRLARIQLLARDSPDYPAALLEIPDPPAVLYLRGRIDPGIVRIAVIGSRTATRYGLRVAAGFGAGLANAGIEVVSGGARGIDSQAHEGALQEEGRTIAVLGSGMLRTYPPENERLFDRIAAEGALLTEFPLDQPPHAAQFPRRNRLISGLSASVVVVEGGLKSGSMLTARHALEQGRDVFAVPGPVTSARSEGCHYLIRSGAILARHVEDVIGELSPPFQLPLERPGKEVRLESAPPPTADEAAVLGFLDLIEPTHLDELAREALFGIPRLQAALFGLELRGAIETLPGGYYLLRN